MSRALSLSPAAAAALEDAVSERLENDRFWATLNARMMLHGERLEASAERTTALIDEMAAAWAADADFNDVWGGMSYHEAVAFQRERGL